MLIQLFNNTLTTIFIPKTKPLPYVCRHVITRPPLVVYFSGPGGIRTVNLFSAMDFEGVSIVFTAYIKVMLSTLSTPVGV